MARAPTTFVAYSMLPRMSVLMKFAATRAQKTSPRRWSNTSSGGTRESMQPTIAANGAWPCAVSFTCSIRLQLTDLPAVKRALPAISRATASSGETSFCRAGVKTAHSEDCAWADVAARPANSAQPQKDRRFSMDGPLDKMKLKLEVVMREKSSDKMLRAHVDHAQGLRNHSMIGMCRAASRG